MQTVVPENLLPIVEKAGFINQKILDSTELFGFDNFAIARINTTSKIKYVPKSGHNQILEYVIPNTSVPFLSGDGAVYYSEVNTVYNVSPEHSLNIQQREGGISLTVLLIDKTLFNSIMRKKGFVFDDLSSPFYASASLSAFIELFIGEYSKDYRDDENVLTPLKKVIISGIIDSAVQNSASDEITTSYFKGIRVAIEYINANFDKELSIHDLADMCGLSYSYFSNCFKKTFGDTPKEYITNLRINKAKYYLTETVIPIKEVSDVCGFSHFNTFTSAFKKYVGVSPREYRKNRTRHDTTN